MARPHLCLRETGSVFSLTLIDKVLHKSPAPLGDYKTVQWSLSISPAVLSLCCHVTFYYRFSKDWLQCPSPSCILILSLPRTKDTGIFSRLLHMLGMTGHENRFKCTPPHHFWESVSHLTLEFHRSWDFVAPSMDSFEIWMAAVPVLVEKVRQLEAISKDPSASLSSLMVHLPRYDTKRSECQMSVVLCSTSFDRPDLWICLYWTPVGFSGRCTSLCPLHFNGLLTNVLLVFLQAPTWSPHRKPDQPFMRHPLYPSSTVSYFLGN